MLSGYGPKAGGQKNDGIDIAAEKGAPVKAADAKPQAAGKTAAKPPSKDAIPGLRLSANAY